MGDDFDKSFSLSNPDVNLTLFIVEIIQMDVLANSHCLDSILIRAFGIGTPLLFVE
jgi:hypothetical protein